MLVGAFTYSTATYQRANFWGIVQTQPNYRVLLGGPTVLAEQTLSPPPAKGKNGSPFGFQAAEVDINWFDGKLQGILATFPQITPNQACTRIVYPAQAKQVGSGIRQIEVMTWGLRRHPQARETSALLTN